MESRGDRRTLEKSCSTTDRTAVVCGQLPLNDFSFIVTESDNNVYRSWAVYFNDRTSNAR